MRSLNSSSALFFSFSRPKPFSSSPRLAFHLCVSFRKRAAAAATAAAAVRWAYFFPPLRWPLLLLSCICFFAACEILTPILQLFLTPSPHLKKTRGRQRIRTGEELGVYAAGNKRRSSSMDCYVVLTLQDRERAVFCATPEFFANINNETQQERRRRRQADRDVWRAVLGRRRTRAFKKPSFVVSQAIEKRLLNLSFLQSHSNLKGVLQSPCVLARPHHLQSTKFGSINVLRKVPPRRIWLPLAARPIKCVCVCACTHVGLLLSGCLTRLYTSIRQVN